MQRPAQERLQNQHLQRSLDQFAFVFSLLSHNPFRGRQYRAQDALSISEDEPLLATEKPRSSGPLADHRPRQLYMQGHAEQHLPHEVHHG